MNKPYSSADILLPDFSKINAEKWAVIACDQFTSEPDYWEKVAKTVGDFPSTLNLILPEVYLTEGEKRIPEINRNMKMYLKEYLVEYPDSMIYVERRQSDGTLRHGIVLAIDLECYDFNRGACSIIRATEATVMERIPPRVAIRRNASIELPHVMLLIDDPDHTVIEPLSECKEPKIAYNTDLMLGGGHITGRFMSEAEKRHVSDALDELTSPSSMKARYGDSTLAPLMFAVGDGNHSLATAKTIYEEIKARMGTDYARNHPARYALAEVVNIHDEALKFEPIYRVIFNVEPDELLQKLSDYLSNLSGNSSEQIIEYLCVNGTGKLTAHHPEKQLTVGTLQDFLDTYVREHPNAEVDYIHGVESVKSLINKNSVGFIFDGMGKPELFKTVIYDGALPRKTFSMGHAEDKRYYIECRKIEK